MTMVDRYGANRWLRISLGVMLLEFVRCGTECSKPPLVEHATFVVHGRPSLPFIQGTVVTYTCNKGFELLGSSNLVCVSNSFAHQAVWKGRVPICREKKICPDPGISKFGKREGTCCFSGDVLHFSCLEGYEIVGSGEMLCLHSGNWSSERPLCKPFDTHCELPPAVPHGAVIGEKEGDYFLPFDEAEIECESGYMHDGPTQFVMCEEDGSWEDEFGECIEIFCDPPVHLENGTIPELLRTSLIQYPYNFEITYRCNDGFRLIGGDSWRFCGKDGWSGRTPHCEGIRCPDPGVPEHGSRQGDSFKVGAKLRFTCFTGYYLLGSVEQYCKPNGQWTGEIARCDAPGNHCPNPGIPINGFKSGSMYDIGDKVQFRCQPGYMHIGSKVRECLQNRTWSGTETKCRSPNDFDNNVQISEFLKTKVANRFDQGIDNKRGIKHFHDEDLALPHEACLQEIYEPSGEGIKGDRISFDLQLRYPVQRNRFNNLGRILDLNYDGRLIIHFAFDVSGSIQLYNFKKSIEFAKAIVKKVGISEYGSRVSATTFSSKAKVIFLPMQIQTEEKLLEQLDAIEYTGGGTSATSALAEIKSIIRIEDSYFDRNKKDVVFIITDGNTNMGGNPEEEANSLKRGGVDIYCIGITGDRRMETLYKIASSSNYGNEERPNVFILENYSAMSHLIQKITNGTTDYSECGLGMENVMNPEIISEGEKKTEPWPWMAALYLQDNTQKIFKVYKLQCGGSIIDENFILTAAHCLYYDHDTAREVRFREKEEIIVKVGLKNVKDESSVQEFDVKKIHIHEMYRPGGYRARLYDYDIALLQLNRPITFGPIVRPICLPPEVLPVYSLLYKSNELGWATGWGYDKVVNSVEFVTFTTTENLKELRLPIQSNERCVKSMEDRNVNKTYFTERMFCAGDGKTGGDTCKGDSGGPLMQSQMNSDGNLFWTQIGIVSWGIGCGLENTYGFYTHVHHLRSWIDEARQTLNA